MIALINMAAWIVALIALIPSAVLLAEMLASFRRPKPLARSDAPPPTAVIAPAHNESRHIAPTLADLKAAAWPQMRIIVVADNCDDDTADVAAASGVEVVERRDPARRGKGYALQFAIDHLRRDPPDIVVFVDADTRFDDQAIDRLVRAAAAADRPVQAIYEMEAGDDPGPSIRIAQFAWRMINIARMQGLSALAGVTRFTGVGLAAPWSALSDFQFGSGAITEDHALTFALASRRRAPLLDPSVRVFSRFPDAGDAMVSQRSRWERGSLGVLRQYGLRGVVKGALSGNRELLAISLDALIPPLVLFACVILAALMFCGVTAIIGSGGPLVAAGLAALAFLISIVIGWRRCGRDILPAAVIPALFPFLWDKLKIYGRRGRETTRTWSRTERSQNRERATGPDRPEE